MIVKNGQHGLSPDHEGGEVYKDFDPNTALPYQENTQKRPRPNDGDLGDIIDQFKDQADKEDTVPNGLLTFEFEGRNSMISDLSSLASYGSEQSLAIENLPDSIKRQFR